MIEIISEALKTSIIIGLVVCGTAGILGYGINLVLKLFRA